MMNDINWTIYLIWFFIVVPMIFWIFSKPRNTDIGSPYSYLTAYLTAISTGVVGFAIFVIIVNILSHIIP